MIPWKQEEYTKEEKGSGGIYGTYEKGASPSGSDVALLWKTNPAGYE
jgi:hypothetical protein